MSSLLIGALSWRIQSIAARSRRRLNTVHLHGPKKILLEDDQVMVTLLARDVGWFLKEFIDYYLGLGAQHILVIDNGSDDSTIDICRSYDRVTLFQNTLPARHHECGFRTEISRRVAKGGWILFADADEMIELPIGPSSNMSQMLAYCNARGFSSILGQVLDRFSLQPYSELSQLDYVAAIHALDRYSLHGVKSVPYHDRDFVEFNWHLRDNICADLGCDFRYGGIRQELFGERPFLSKHSFVRNLPQIQLMTHAHCASGVSMADFTVLVHHYKLAGDWIARDRISVAQSRWDYGEDKQRLNVVGENDDFRLNPANPLSWRGIETLENEGFIYTSAEFRRAMKRSDLQPLSRAS